MDSKLFTPYQLGPLTLKNRIVKAATFEGVMRAGKVTDELIDFHRRVAAGGAAMTTVAYCAVMPSGRVQRNTIVMDPAIVGDLRRLTTAVHDEGGLISAQLGHAGLVANTRSNRMATLAPSTRWSSPAMALVKAATTEQINEVVAAFATATRVAIDAGFDAVEVHMGHNYLPSSFMAPNLNKRKDQYGGSIENRARFPREILGAVREAAGTQIAVTTKFNMADGVPKGIWPEESLQIAALIEADGHVGKQPIR